MNNGIAGWYEFLYLGVKKLASRPKYYGISIVLCEQKHFRVGKNQLENQVSLGIWF